MNLSFLATIAFALLAIAGAFIANLVVLVFTNSHWHLSGVILAIVAAGLSYWAQHCFTAAGYARDVAEAATQDSVRFQSSVEAMNRSESFGVAFQYGALAALAASVACVWLGMR